MSFSFYPAGSGAQRWQRVGAALAVLAVLGTAWAVFDATRRRDPDLLFVLAAAWGIAPPLWWWLEFFFVYPRHHDRHRFELLKHAAQASLAIWAPIAVALAAYAASERFDPPPTPAPCAARAPR